jgi:hypothetical protein
MKAKLQLPLFHTLAPDQKRELIQLVKTALKIPKGSDLEKSNHHRRYEQSVVFLCEHKFLACYSRRTTPPRVRIRVLLKQTKPLGFISYQINSSKHLVIRHAVIAVDSRQNGYGRKMVQRLIWKHSLNQNSRKTRVRLSEYNVEAQCFFKRCGFLHIKTSKGGKGEFFYWMENQNPNL